jgi:dTDP-4-dehydrorhamnose 3,5-epimerase
MKIVEVKALTIPEVKIIKMGRFADDRGYFTESFRQSDLEKVIPGFKLLQINESFSKKNVIRGLHIQLNPYMGKFVRTVKGRMLDIAVDIRLGSPTFGKGIIYDLPTNQESETFEAIWVPVGFVHGCVFLEETIIEYLCTSEYSPGNEACVLPDSPEIDWSLADQSLVKIFQETLKNAIISEKDKAGVDFKDWVNDPRSKNFNYEV